MEGKNMRKILSFISVLFIMIFILSCDVTPVDDPYGDGASFFENFETNKGGWSVLHDGYELYSAGQHKPDKDLYKYPFVQKGTVKRGNWSAQFGDVDNNEYSLFKIKVKVDELSHIDFFYKVDCEEKFDNFYFGVDADMQTISSTYKLKASGKVDWTRFKCELTVGEHTLLWVYKKDSMSSKGCDTAWVDDISVRKQLPEHDLKINTIGNGWVTKKLDGQVSYMTHYEEGTVITLEAEAGSGDSFTKWSGKGIPAEDVKKPSISITMGKSDMEIGAEFTGEVSPLDWLIMVYADGDCNLETQIWGDLNEMELGLHELSDSVRNNIRVVVLWDGIPQYEVDAPEGARLYELGPDSESNNLLSLATKDLTETKWWTGDEVDMSNGATLTAFLKWAKEVHPDYVNTMLILSDHGGGPRSRGGKLQRGIIWDDTAGEDHFLETKEFSQALDAAGFNGENKLSLLGLDACLMASVEEAYEHRTVADYYVASLQTEQGDGWEYDHWIPQITKGMTPAGLGTVLVESYRTNFINNSGGIMGESDDQTLSCTDLSKMDNLKTTIDALGKAIKDNNLVTNCKAKFEESTSFGGSWADLHEVGDFVSRLSSTAVSAEATAVTNAMKEAIVYSWADANKGNYFGPGSSTGKGLHLMGKISYPEDYFEYGPSILSFADGDWAELYNEWYPQS